MTFSTRRMLADGLELVDEHPHRHAGPAGVAGRPVGDGLRATEAALRQDLVQIPAAPSDDMREDFPLLLARQIGAADGEVR